MKVLIGYDGTEYADAALADIQRAGLPQLTEAFVISVTDSRLPPPPPSSFEITGVAISTKFAPTETGSTSAGDRAAEEQAHAGCERLRALFPKWQVHAIGQAGPAAETILQQARQLQPDLIVVGTHDRSAFGRFIFGSVSKQIAEEAPYSVRIARPAHAPRVDLPVRLMIALNESPGGQLALRAVTARVWPAGSEACVILVDERSEPTGIKHPVPAGSVPGNPQLDQKLARLRELGALAVDVLRLGAGLVASFIVKDGDPQKVLLEEAEAFAAESIFVGARGFYDNPDEPGLSTVATALATGAPCSVEVVRS